MQAPRFRQDLLAELIEDNGKRFIDVADPDNGTCYRFYEVEYSLACAMDGERDVAGIVKWATDELGVTPKPDEVKSVIATLGSLGFIDGSGGATKPAAQPSVNRWDAPTAMGDAGDYLEPGVVVPKSAPVAARGEDVELGNAGGARGVSVDLPKAPELELGAPGGSAAKVEKTIRTQEIPLGAPGKAPDLSLDLAEQVSVKPDDVKEAVRASQVMKAVDVPKELADSIESKPAAEAKKPEPKVEAKKPEPKVEAKKPEPKPAEKKPEPKPAEKKPEPKPAEKKPAAAAPKAPPAPQSGTSPMLIAALVLVFLGAGAFFAYKYVIKKSDDTDKQSQSQQPPPPKPEPPPPPPVEVEKLASETPAAIDLKLPGAGQLDMIVANDATVKTGEVVAALAGHKPIETEIAALQTDISKRLQADVAAAERDRDAAEKAGNKPGVTAAEKKIETAKKALDDKQQKLATRAADLDKLVVKAPVAGKVSVVGKSGAKVTATDIVAKLQPEMRLVTTFKSTTPPVPVDGRVLLATKSGEHKLSCKVVDAAAGTKIACPLEAAPEGTEVTFAGIDTSPQTPPPGEEIEMGEEGSGSAGSAAALPKAPPPPPAPPPARPAPQRLIRPPVTPKPPDKQPEPKGSDQAPAPAPTPAPAGSGSAAGASLQ
jgi:hypothetical protein